MTQHGTIRHFGSSHSGGRLSENFLHLQSCICTDFHCWITADSMSSAGAHDTQASEPVAATPVAEVADAAAASVEAEIAAATGRGELVAAPPAEPGVPEFMRDVPDGLVSNFLVQLGADPDTALADVMCVPEADLNEAMTGMAYLGPIQKGKLIRELRGLWESAGYAPPGLGAPLARPAPAPAPPPTPTLMDETRRAWPLEDHRPTPGAMHPTLPRPEVLPPRTGQPQPSAETIAAAHAGAGSGFVPVPAAAALGAVPAADQAGGNIPTDFTAAAGIGQASVAAGNGQASGSMLAVPGGQPTVIPQTALMDIPLRRYVDQALEGTAKAFNQDALDACAARYLVAYDVEPPRELRADPGAVGGTQPHHDDGPCTLRGLCGLQRVRCTPSSDD